MADVTGQFVASNTFVGYGTELLVGQGETGSPETFVAVPNVESITFGDMTTGVVDVTHLRSPGRHREKRATIRDSGAITFVIGYDPAHGAFLQTGGDGFGATRSLLTLWRNVTNANFKLILPEDADEVELPIVGTVTKYQIGEFSLDQPVKLTVEITPLEDFSGDLP